MFKYISDIIGKFTPQQRILALLVLMFTLVLIYLGPKLISKNQCEDCVTKNIEQANQISDLYDRIKSQQSECTDELYEREMSFRKRLDTLEKMLVSLQQMKPVVSIKTETEYRESQELYMIHQDTIQGDSIVPHQAASSAPSPSQEIIITKEKIVRQPMGVDEVLDKIHCYQKDSL